eukprot:Phypoly_transcript_13395.p2 GENE.Phypoly_transcript_13395~~Phypoly_transcript_13395.p2  ORF type:complete len:141 (+),score=49.82 Phypoly_transcript_13395:71-493(+)
MMEDKRNQAVGYVNEVFQYFYKLNAPPQLIDYYTQIILSAPPENLSTVVNQVREHIQALGLQRVQQFSIPPSSSPSSPMPSPSVPPSAPHAPSAPSSSFPPSPHTTSSSPSSPFPSPSPFPPSASPASNIPNIPNAPANF